MSGFLVMSAKVWIRTASGNGFIVCAFTCETRYVFYGIFRLMLL